MDNIMVALKVSLNINISFSFMLNFHLFSVYNLAVMGVELHYFGLTYYCVFLFWEHYMIGILTWTINVCVSLANYSVDNYFRKWGLTVVLPRKIHRQKGFSDSSFFHANFVSLRFEKIADTASLSSLFSFLFFLSSFLFSFWNEVYSYRQICQLRITVCIENRCHSYEHKNIFIIPVYRFHCCQVNHCNGNSY